MSTPENAADHASPAELGAAVAASEIPNKLYFRIGDVARLAGIKPYVLRFWETEFPALGPKKSGTGHRLYRRKDVEMVLEIKRLLYEQRFTIEGARKFLDDRAKPDAAGRFQQARQAPLRESRLRCDAQRPGGLIRRIAREIRNARHGSQGIARNRELIEVNLLK